MHESQCEMVTHKITRIQCIRRENIQLSQTNWMNGVGTKKTRTALDIKQCESEEKVQTKCNIKRARARYTENGAIEMVNNTHIYEYIVVAVGFVDRHAIICHRNEWMRFACAEAAVRRRRCADGSNMGFAIFGAFHSIKWCTPCKHYRIPKDILSLLPLSLSHQV